MFNKYTAFSLLAICFCSGTFFDEILFSRSVSALLFVMLPFAKILFAKELDKFHKKNGLSLVLISTWFITILFLIDNLRAGVRFQVIEVSPYSTLLLITVILLSVMYMMKNTLSSSRRNSNIL